jgi:23S rRNA pseudouridine2605 synthase
MGRRIDPDTAVVHVDGMRIVLREEMEYLAFNKPLGVHTTMSDEKGRPCVGDYIRRSAAGGRTLFHVGRLDAETEGLLLLTNDGELGHRLTHPSFHVTKTYLADVMGTIPKDLGKRLRTGIELEDGMVKVDGFKLVDTVPGQSLVEVKVHEGRKHIVRRMLAEVGFPVHRLVRTEVGDVQLGNQRPGTLRRLNHQEIGSLFAAVGL